MNLKTKWLMLALMLTLSAVFLVSTDGGATYPSIDGGYVGSAVCGECHDTIKADFDKSGHPYKVRFTNGKTPFDDSSCVPGTIVGSTICDPLSTLLTPKMPLLSALLNPNSETDVKNAGTNLDWSVVSFVIGGYGWKARWGVKDTVDDTATGFIWSSSSGSTSGTGAQFNMLAADPALDPDDRRSDYSSYGSATKKYSCAICHNTNGTNAYSSTSNCNTNLGSGRSEPWASTGLAYTAPGGFRSEWSLSGVQCEACHGPGDAHANAATPTTSTVTQGSNTSKDACGKCHIRSTNTTSPLYDSECGGTGAILTNGAQNNGGSSIANQSVQHHEQYNELVGLNNDGVHHSLDCVSCHEPHKRAHKVTSAIAAALHITDNNVASDDPARGAVVPCSNCHYGKTSSKPAGGPYTATSHASLTCNDCHMAETTKSATIAAGAWGAQGDVKGHIFKISPSATTMDRTNGQSVHIATNYITVNYACGKCHDNSTALSATYSGHALTVTDAMTAAAGYHSAIANIDGGYVGSAVCGSCHTTIKADFDKTGHPYKVRFTDGNTPFDDSVCVPGTIVGSTICDPLSTLLTPKLPLLSALINPNSETNVKNAGTNLDWSVISYVIGGYGWKARWGVKDNADDSATGFIWSSSGGSTSGTGAQFNMLAADTTLDPNPPDARSDYSSYGSATKKYSCAICHNTNGTNAYSSTSNCNTNLGSGRTEPWASTGLTTTNHGGFASEWTLSGVQCEECHGTGLNHARAASASNITVNTDASACGKCHIRSTNTKTPLYDSECGGEGAILTNGAQNNGGTSLANQSVQHHEQYNEMVGYNGNGVHASLDCVACHDPHKRAHKVTSAIAGALDISDNNVASDDPARGAVVSCNTCHATGTPLAAAGGADTKVSGLLLPMTGVTCIDCHMAETTKSATIQTGSWGAKGDVKGHIFAINPTATTMDTTNAESPAVHIATNYITVNWACGKCHDSAMTGHTTTTLTQSQAQLYGQGMHSALADATCAQCHTEVSYHATTNTATVKTPSAFDTNGCKTCHVGGIGTSGVPVQTGNYEPHHSPAAPLATVDVANTCGYCHGTDGATGTHNGAPAHTLAQLTGWAGQIHQNAPDQPPTISLGACSVNSCTGLATMSYTVTDGIDLNNLDATWGTSPASSLTFPGASDTSAAGTVTHTYSTNGTFNVTGTVYDSIGQSAVATTTCARVAPSNYSIAVTVKNHAGTLNAATAKVVLKYSNGTTRTGYTGSNGQYTFGNVPDCTSYTITVTKAGWTFTIPAASGTISGANASHTINALTP